MSSLPKVIAEPEATGIDMARVNIAKAELTVHFDLAPEGQTYISHQYASYPFHICRAQYVDSKPEGLATVYLQSSSGGIFENDDLNSEFHGLENTRSHITTQASTIVHRMDNGSASQNVNIKVEPNSLMEYLPEPVIMFPESELRSTVQVQIDPSASLIMADGFTNHDPKEQQGRFRSYFSEISVENPEQKLLCLDRYHVTGEQFLLGERGVMGENKIQSTFLLITQSVSLETSIETLRKSLEPDFSGYAGATLLPNGCGIMVRILATEVYQARSAIQTLWAVSRDLILNLGFPTPRRK